MRRMCALSSMTRKRKRLKSIRTMVPQPGHDTGARYRKRQATGAPLTNGLACCPASNGRLHPRYAGRNDLIHRCRPPPVGEDLDLDAAAEALRFDGRPDAWDIDDAIAHHS